VYHLAEYQLALTPMDTGHAVLAVVEDDESDFLAALPLRIRQVNEAEAVAEAGSFGDEIADAISPYGYPGLIGRGSLHDGDDPDGPTSATTRRFSLTLDALLTRHGVVSAFIRLHPVIETSSWFVGPFRVKTVGPTVAINLAWSERAYIDQCRKSHRDALDEWQQRSPILKEGRAEALTEFQTIYRRTMQRKGADARYLFDDAYFAQLARLPENGCRVFSAYDRESESDKADAMAVVLTCGRSAHYHLAATSDVGARSGISRWLLEQIRRQLKGEGFETMHLGGGVGGQEDSLFHFKAGFSTWRPTFSVVTWIGDQRVYDELCAATRTEYTESFFPAYRLRG